MSARKTITVPNHARACWISNLICVLIKNLDPVWLKVYLGAPKDSEFFHSGHHLSENLQITLIEILSRTCCAIIL